MAGDFAGSAGLAGGRSVMFRAGTGGLPGKEAGAGTG